MADAHVAKDEAKRRWRVWASREKLAVRRFSVVEGSDVEIALVTRSARRLRAVKSIPAFAAVAPVADAALSKPAGSDVRCDENGFS
jgi:hypothetical protein